MRHTCLWGAVLAVSIMSWAGAPALAETAQQQREIKLGRSLFLYEWKENDPLSVGGDGLGPLHNDISCVACHSQGGVGGSGTADKNIEMVSLDLRGLRSIRNVQPLLERMQEIHPRQINDQGQLHLSFMLHRASTTDGYDQWRKEFLAGEFWKDDNYVPKRVAAQLASQKKATDESPVKLVGYLRGVRYYLSQRNSPALFGADWIDKIPEQVIRTIAEQQRRVNPELAGRVSINEGLVGRFGWRGQNPSLEDFVLRACADEMGLAVIGHEQPANPLDPNYQMTKYDVDVKHADALVSFVRSLDAPKQRWPENVDAQQRVKHGEAVFASAGCAFCHQPKLGNVEGLYSDLLLHDMGESLSDPLPATPRVTMHPLLTSGSNG